MVPMDERQKEKLVRICGEGVRFDCPMQAYTTFRVGGHVEALCFVRKTEDLKKLFSFLYREEIPSLVVGRGSNLLVRDGGLSGVAIILRGDLATFEGDEADESRALVGAGLTIPELLVHCREKGLGGLEFLSGIPGTVGGAVAMNAGAWGQETGAHVQAIKMINRQGEISWENRSTLRFSYRNLAISTGSVILRVIFDLTPGDPGRIAAEISEYLKQRRGRQPLSLPSAGSIFKNPPNDFAGRLIERAGLKGTRVGGAMISRDHANFIVNTGQAKAKDILALMALAAGEVRKRFGVDLEPEIRIVGREDR